MNTKRIIFWVCFIGVLGLIVWGLILAMNKDPNKLSKSLVPAPVTATDHVRGNIDAPVTLIEYEDFQCPACGVYFPVIEKVFNESSTTLRMVFRHFPLLQHPNAIPASTAAEAASNQGKFWQMYSLIYANQADWAEKSNSEAEAIFDGYAGSLGMDLAMFKSDRVSSSTLSKVMVQQQEGVKIGIDHTPTFFINGKEVNSESYSYEEIKKLVDEAASNVTK